MVGFLSNFEAKIMVRISFCVVKRVLNEKSHSRKKSISDCHSMWAHLGLNQGPPDYESGALTN